MNLSLRIALRYLFSKKSHNAINIISAISVCGVTLATLALVCTLSVFNGFHDLVESMFTNIDPKLKIEAAKGRTFEPTDSLLSLISSTPGVEVITPTLQNNAMAQYRLKQVMVTVKGVADNFRELTTIDDILYGEGTFMLQDEVVDYGILGIQIPYILNSGIHFLDPLTLYAPKSGTRVNFANPMANFNMGRLHSPGVVFCVNQDKYDASYIITSLDFARKLFDCPTAVSALELKTSADVSPDRVKKALRRTLGDDYTVSDRYEQQEEVFKIVEIEKFISYLFLCFILLVACFNIISSVSMLILDKQANIATLRSMGADDSLIRRVFLWEGNLISFFGATLGLVLGVILCLIQQHFGLLTLGESGAFVVDAYPVSVHFSDVVLIFITVIIVSSLAVWLPIRILGNRLLGQEIVKEE